VRDLNQIGRDATVGIITFRGWAEWQMQESIRMDTIDKLADWFTLKEGLHSNWKILLIIVNTLLF
jgi:hypothetical protein